MIMHRHISQAAGKHKRAGAEDFNSSTDAYHSVVGGSKDVVIRRNHSPDDDDDDYSLQYIRRSYFVEIATTFSIAERHAISRRPVDVEITFQSFAEKKKPTRKCHRGNPEFLLPGIWEITRPPGKSGTPRDSIRKLPAARGPRDTGRALIEEREGVFSLSCLLFAFFNRGRGCCTGAS